MGECEVDVTCWFVSETAADQERVAACEAAQGEIAR